MLEPQCDTWSGSPLLTMREWELGKSGSHSWPGFYSRALLSDDTLVSQARVTGMTLTEERCEPIACDCTMALRTCDFVHRPAHLREPIME